MFYPESFEVTTPSDCEIQVRRDFHAPRRLVFDAFTKPHLVRRWLLGPPGWTMPVCDINLTVGGAYRYVWRSEADGTEMGIGGVFREIVAPARLVASEKFDQSWYPGEALDTTVFVEAGDITQIRITVRYESTEARNAARASGMEQGMAMGYDRLEELLPALRSEALSRPSIGIDGEASAIRALLESWASATRQGRPDDVMANHAADVLVYDVLPPMKYESAAAYRKSWDDWQPDTQGEARFELEDLSVTAGADVAFAHGFIQCGGTLPNGRTFQDTVRATFCLGRANGQWKVLHQHISKPLP